MKRNGFSTPVNGRAGATSPRTRSESLPCRPRSSDEYLLVTGGAGFIGTNLVSRAVQKGHRVLILDNLSRPGVEKNLRWLKKTYAQQVDVVVGDVRDPAAVRYAVEGAAGVFHFAAQVAV